MEKLQKQWVQDLKIRMQEIDATAPMGSKQLIMEKRFVTELSENLSVLEYYPLETIIKEVGL